MTMKIQIDFNRDQWCEFAREIPDEAYTILEDHWEDQEEWADIEILDPKWKTWISLKHPEWIVND
jgi:hypothetical protein